MSGALNTQACSYQLQGDYVSALSYFNQSLILLKELENKKGVASLLGNIGGIYYAQGKSLKALEYYKMAQVIQEEMDDKKGTASTLNSIGNIYKDQSENNKSLEYYQKSLEIFKELDIKRGIAMSLSNIGNIYSNLKNNDKALEYFQKSLTLIELTTDKVALPNTLNSIGVVYLRQEEYKQALEYFQKSLIAHQELGNKRGIAISMNNIGEVYGLTGEYSKALDYCSQGLNISMEIESYSIQKLACNCVYQAHKALGNNNKALGFLEQLRIIEDSLNHDETSKKLQQMEFANQVYQDSVEAFEHERQVELTHQKEIQKEEQQRNLAIVVGGLFVIVAGGFYSRWRFVRKSKAVLQTEKDRSDNLLHNILPAEVAAELKEKGESEAKDFDEVTVLFSDFQQFTQTAENLSAKELVKEINTCFKAFDEIMHKYGIEKIKTIGDAYMAAGGLHKPRTSEPKDVVKAALEMQAFMLSRKAEHDVKGEPAFEMRVGIHTGPVVAGIVGVKKFQYDIWGDTVNTASRMESSGEVGKVNISHATYELLKDDEQFTFEHRGKVQAKGKGKMEMHFVHHSS
jgi:class 3 adenylate cyclase/TPR repeat protein